MSCKNILIEYLKCNEDEVIRNESNDYDNLESYNYKDTEYIIGIEPQVDEAIFKFVVLFIDQHILPHKDDEKLYNENLEELDLINKNNRGYMLSDYDGKEIIYKDYYIYRMK